MKSMGLAMFALCVSLLTATKPRQGEQRSCCAVMDRAIEDYAKVKPGATRADVEELFHGAGILDTPGSTSYSSRYCTCIKVDIKYEVTRPLTVPFSPKDKVITKSQLYLEAPCLTLESPPAKP